MTRILTFRPPRIALGLLAAAAVGAYLSPTGTVLHVPYRFPGTLLSAGGFLVVMWAWLSFRRARTAICLTSESAVLISYGAYRLSRNPMYLGMLSMLFGVAFLMGNLIAFLAPVAFYLVMDKVFVPYEEADLRRSFRGDYERYAERVRRWV